MKWVLFLALSCGSYFLFKSSSSCVNYYPLLFNESDTLLTNDFILVNSSNCSRDSLNVMIDYSISNGAVIILTIDNKVDRAFEMGGLLNNSVILCDEKVVKFKTKQFKDWMSMLTVDTILIRDEIYINFFNGDYRNFFIATINNYREVNYKNKIVIVGKMGSSFMLPTYDLQSEVYNTPELGVYSHNIYKSQLLGLIAYTLQNPNSIIVELPEYLAFILSFTLCVFLFILAEWVLSLKYKLLFKYLSFKVFQIIILIPVVLLLIFISQKWKYVSDFNMLVLVIFIGGEIFFWLAYLLRSRVNRNHKLFNNL